MELYLLRHTTAADPHGYAQDADRPLTDAGKKEAEAVGRAIKKMGDRIQLALSSPYLRARQTAQIVANVLALEPPEDSGLLLPGADHSVLLEQLSQRRAESVLLVGHAPDLSYLVSLLCIGQQSAMPAMGKGALAVLEVERPVRKRSAYLTALVPLSISEMLAK